MHTNINTDVYPNSLKVFLSSSTRPCDLFFRRTCCGRSAEHSFAMQGLFQKILAMSFQDAGHQTSNLNRQENPSKDPWPSWLCCSYHHFFELSDPCHTVDPWTLRGNRATMLPGPFHRTGQESLEVWLGAAGDECRLPENDCQGVLMSGANFKPSKITWYYYTTI